MEQLVSLVAVGLAEVFLVEFPDLRIVVRLTVCLSLILEVQRFGSLFLIGIHNVIIFVRQEEFTYIRLAAAVDTASGASHYLYELILGLAGPYIVQQYLCGFHTGCYSHIYGSAVDIYRSLSYARFMSADSLEGDGICFLTGKLVLYGTQGSFHNTAGNTEDDACT